MEGKSPEERERDLRRQLDRIQRRCQQREMLAGIFAGDGDGTEPHKAKPQSPPAAVPEAPNPPAHAAQAKPVTEGISNLNPIQQERIRQMNDSKDFDSSQDYSDNSGRRSPLVPRADISERAVIGGALIDYRLLSGAFAQISVGDFYLSAHRILFSLFLELAERGQAFDDPFIASLLEERQQLDLVGGAPYLFDCQRQNGDCPLITSPDSIMRSHAAAVINAARLRRYQRVSEALAKDVTRPRAEHEGLQLKYSELFDSLAKGYDLDGNLTPVMPRSLARRADIVRLDRVEAKQVEWLWEPYLPLDMLSMFSSDPGVGKTYVAMAIAAGLSKGRLPGGKLLPEALDTLYLTVENSAEYVLRQRFNLLGGDPRRFHVLRGSITGDDADGQRGGIVLSDIALLSEALEYTKAKLVVIDPIQSYLGADVNAFVSNETRPILDGLSRLAEKYHCAILLLRHLTKGTSKALYRGQMSIDFTAATRSEMVLGFVPNHPRRQRAIAHLKSNIGPMGASVPFNIDAFGKFYWEEGDDVTVDELLSAPDPEEGSALREAVDYLREALAAGSRDSKEVIAEASGTGISSRTLRRARAKLNIKPFKSPEQDGSWRIRLPETDAGNQT
jgi:hypothetical protein